MTKSVRRQKLVDRLWITVELKPKPASTTIQGCVHETEVENTTTLVYDAVVHSKVVEGTVQGTGQNSSDIQHRFTDLLDSPARRSSFIAYSASTPKTVKVHTHKLSWKSDIEPNWTDELVDPVVETAVKL